MANPELDNSPYRGNCNLFMKRVLYPQAKEDHLQKEKGMTKPALGEREFPRFLCSERRAKFKGVNKQTNWAHVLKLVFTLNIFRCLILTSFLFLFILLHPLPELQDFVP